jgi:hypothetical protein
MAKITKRSVDAAIPGEREFFIWDEELRGFGVRTRVIEGAAIIDRYFEQSFKPTARIIADHANRFASLSDVDDVRVMGHSLSDVDLPYLAQVTAHVRPHAR